MCGVRVHFFLNTAVHWVMESGNVKRPSAHFRQYKAGSRYVAYSGALRSWAAACVGIWLFPAAVTKSQTSGGRKQP